MANHDQSVQLITEEFNGSGNIRNIQTQNSKPDIDAENKIQISVINGQDILETNTFYCNDILKTENQDTFGEKKPNTSITSNRKFE